MFSASKTAAPVSGAYSVKQSLRFRSSASAYLNRTPSVAGNRQTWTWSGWVKRGILGAYQAIFCQGTGTASNGYAVLRFTNSDTLTFYSSSDNVTTNIEWTTSAVFRDPSAWYQITVVLDTTQASASNRFKIYVNGSLQVGSYTATPAQNLNTQINTASAHQIGVANTNVLNFYSDCYLAEVNFIDGQALIPSSFGAYNATTGVWQPARYTGSYGTNGFYLTFGNKTSTTTLGNDTSGNGNNWTTNNISLTAGSTYDSMLDSPTNYDDGGNGVGNYAVLNPLGKGSGVTLSNANLTWSITLNNSVAGSIGMSSGKWYWEVVAGSNTYEGIVLNTASLQNQLAGIVGGYCYSPGGNKYAAGNSPPYAAYGAAYTSGDIIGVTFDADTGTLTFYKNGVSQGVAYSGIASGIYFPAVGSDSGSTATGSINFGQRPFSYTPPSGFKSLNTQNLPTPAIVNGAGYMAATTYTGTLLSNSITNSGGFQPDLVWIKSRSAATDHKLTDSVRGVTKGLISNTTGAETTDTTGLTAFNSSGFTLGTSITYNNLAATYIAWQWKANGTAVSNTSGTITSQVSANTTAGFSVVTWTHSSTTYTIGHGLGVDPSFIILKDRTTAYNWDVYSAVLGNTVRLILNSSGATTSGFWNNTSPTSTVFTYAGSGANNGDAMVAYCFAAIAGYSAFGGYTGNGSTDGPFVFLGFRPRFILVKRTDSSGNYWIVLDTSRNTYNLANLSLYPNDMQAEDTGIALTDILSNGFKIRTSSAIENGSGATYIYAAFAENPFKNSLAR